MTKLTSYSPAGRTSFLTIMITLLLLGATVIPIAAATKKPDKGKPSSGMRQIMFLQSEDPSLWSANLEGNLAAFIAYVEAKENDDLVTFVRANSQGDHYYQLCFTGESWDEYETFHPGDDLEMQLSWDTHHSGTIAFYFWFPGRPRLVAESGTFIRDNDMVYHVVLSEVQIFEYDPTIQGAPHNRYKVALSVETVTFNFIIDLP